MDYIAGLLFLFSSEIDSSSWNRNPELFVECTLYIDGAPFGLPTKTRFPYVLFPTCICITLFPPYCYLDGCYMNSCITLIYWLFHDLKHFLSHARLESSGPPYCWNERITLSSKYRDLTSRAQLAFTVSWLGYFACINLDVGTTFFQQC